MEIIVLRKPEWEGICRVREIPQEWTEVNFLKYWFKMSERERDRYTVYSSKNLITNIGLQNLNAYLSTISGTLQPFALYFAVGTGAFNGPLATDTALAGESFRKAISGVTTVGSQFDYSTVFGASEGNGTYTNSGLFGHGASATPGSGDLNTHVPYAYTKVNGVSITSDYLLSRIVAQ